MKLSSSINAICSQELANEQFKEPLSETTEIVQFNRRVFEELEPQAKAIAVQPRITPEACRNSPSTPPSNFVLHPTVLDVIKTYPTLKIPVDLLKCDITPSVALDPDEVERWTPPTPPEDDPNQSISDLERFKKMCPGILITKVCGSPDVLQGNPVVIKAEKPNALNKRKLTESPINVLAKKIKISPVIFTKAERRNSDVVVSEIETTVTEKQPQLTPTSTEHCERQVPKLKISLRKSPDQSQFCAVLMNDKTNKDDDSSHQQPAVQRKRRTSRKSPDIQRNISASSESPAMQFRGDTSRESPAVQMSKGSFLESLEIQRKMKSQKELPVCQRSRQLSVESPAIQHNLENSTEETMGNLLVAPELSDHRETETTSLVNRKIIIEDESDNDDDRGFDTENLLDTFDEEIVITCSLCNKMFSTPQQRTAHERVHRCCIICKMLFRSLDALFYHQREICFKKVIANPPTLELVRVDDQPIMAEIYAKALARQEECTVTKKDDKVSDVLCISDDDDDDVIIVGQSSYRPKEMDSEYYKQTPSEFQFISRIFGKYTSLIQPNAKIKATETKPRIFVRYNKKSQIVLENMFPELQNYRVPVELVAKPNAYAYISFAKKPPKQYNTYCWTKEPVVGLNEKKSFLSILLNTQSDNAEVTRVPQVFTITQLENRPQTVTTEMAHTPITLPQTQVAMTKPLVNETRTPIVMTESLVDVTETSITPGNATQDSINVPLNPFQLLQRADMQSARNQPQPIIKVAIPRNPRGSYIQPKPSTSKSALLGSVETTSSGLTNTLSGPSTSTKSDMKIGLRVKTLSELL